MDDRNRTESETAQLAEFVCETEFEELPDRVVARAKRRILDVIGVTAFGSTQPPGQRAASFVIRFQSGDDATIIGRESASLAGAALSNGVAAHATDFDDSFIGRPVIHPSAPIFSALLPIAEFIDASGTDVLTAYVTGCEVARRVGEAMNPNHYQHGFHSTGTIGSFGATSAAASLIGLSRSETANAFAIVASSSSALKADNFGTMTKPYSAGHAASMGVRAALLAEEEFTGDTAVLDGRFGYGNVMTPGYYDPSAITTQLGEAWRGMKIKRKLYPCGSYYQGMCEAFRRLVAREALTSEEVDTIEVTFAIPSSARKKPKRPKTGIEARFSARFLLATILVEKDLRIDHFSDEFVQAPEIRTQMEKVIRKQDPTIVSEPIEHGRHPIRSTAEVRVQSNTGDEYIEAQQYSPDSTKHPIPEERFEQKFITCAQQTLADEQVSRVAELVADLERLDNISRLTTELV